MLKTKHKIALASLAQTVVMGGRRLLGKGCNARVVRSNANWDLDLREGIDFAIWLVGAFEPETVRCYRHIVQAGDVVLDIGANIGAHTLLLAQAVGAHGKVIAFEPTDYAYEKLSKNRALNPNLAGRIRCLQIMLVDSEMAGNPTPGLYSSWPLKDEACLHELHQGRLMETSGAQARTLDSVIVELGLDRVDCIKLDIDGFECGMMRGSDNVLTRWHPAIIMELAPYALEEQGASLRELIELLKDYGYALFDLSRRHPLIMEPGWLQAQIPMGASLNVIALASSASA
ncbi:MAG: FkbM family methyltransferase [Nitrospira sp.]